MTNYHMYDKSQKYDAILWDVRKTVIGEASLGEDGAIRVNLHLMPLDGVFYLKPKKAKKASKLK